MDDKAMVARIGTAKFPQELSQSDVRLLSLAARTYGFDPILGEISIYQGRPFISIDGRYRKAQETKMFDGIETRPANKQEKTDWDIPDGDYFFRSECWVKGSSRPFVGWGRVRQSEINPNGKFKPVDVNPQRMAEKRAEAQALRKAFHIPLPSIEDIGSPEPIATDVIINVSSAPPMDTSLDAQELPIKQEELLPENFDTFKGADKQESVTPITKETRQELFVKIGSITGQTLKDATVELNGRAVLQVSEQEAKRILAKLSVK
jgi:hypothetical protein